MKQISIPYLKFENVQSPLFYNELWDNLPKHPLDTLNWPAFPYKPEVTFSMGYSDRGIFLKFWVIEEGIRGMVTEDNGRVYTDSCVELFIDPSGDGSYYNLEFNCLGYLLLGYGPSRQNRERASQEVMSKVLRMPSLGNEKIEKNTGLVDWNLTVFIPCDVFYHHQIGYLSGKILRANFQKCGDETVVPHFVTWNPIDTPKPDYHRPDFFGQLKFL